MSQTSSPLSQSDSCTGRSADLLLPLGDTGKKRQESSRDIASFPRTDRIKIQVRVQLSEMLSVFIIIQTFLQNSVFASKM